MAFQLITDMGGLKGAAATALELRSKIFTDDGKLWKHGLFVARDGVKLTEAEFFELCAAEEREA